LASPTADGVKFGKTDVVLASPQRLVRISLRIER
jgi:hypothetical protein